MIYFQLLEGCNKLFCIIQPFILLFSGTLNLNFIFRFLGFSTEINEQDIGPAVFVDSCVILPEFPQVFHSLISILFSTFTLAFTNIEAKIIRRSKRQFQQFQNCSPWPGQWCGNEAAWSLFQTDQGYCIRNAATGCTRDAGLWLCLL